MKYSTHHVSKLILESPRMVRTWQPCYGSEMLVILWHSSTLLQVPLLCTQEHFTASALQTQSLAPLLTAGASSTEYQFRSFRFSSIQVDYQWTSSYISEACCQAPGVPHTLQVNCPHALESPPPFLIVCLLKRQGKWGVSGNSFTLKFLFSTCGGLLLATACDT